MDASPRDNAATRRAARPRAVVALLFVTLIWGWSFIWMKWSLVAAERVLGRQGGAPLVAFYMAVRFALGAAMIAGFPSARRGHGKAVWQGGALLGGLLLAGFLLQMIGLQAVSPAVSAFLTSLYVVFSALITVALTGTVPRLSLWLGAALATFGAGFIGGPPHLTFGSGEWLTVGCAAVFAGQILATDRVTRRSAPMPVTLATFVTAAAGSLAALSLFTLGGSGLPASSYAALLRDAGFTVPLLLSTVFATVVGLTLMNLYQREMDPVRAAILYATEPVWTAVIAIGLGLDRAGFWLLVGGAALLAGNLVAEVGGLGGSAADRRPKAPTRESIS